MTRWSIEVPVEIDAALRAFLGDCSGVSLASFVADAVERRLDQLEIERVKSRNAVFETHEVEQVIDEAVASARANRP